MTVSLFIISNLIISLKLIQAIKERFAHSQKILNLRHKYYEEYSKFLSQQQIAQLERKMMERLYHRSQKGKTQKQ